MLSEIGLTYLDTVLRSTYTIINKIVKSISASGNELLYSIISILTITWKFELKFNKISTIGVYKIWRKNKFQTILKLGKCEHIFVHYFQNVRYFWVVYMICL